MKSHPENKALKVSTNLCILIDLKQQRGGVGVVAQADPVPAVVERLLGQAHLAVRL